MSESIEEDNNFTKEEISAIRSLKRAFKKCPSTLRLYSTGDDLCICKAGSSSDLQMSIIDVRLNVGVYLSDLHEEQDYGRDNSPILKR